MLDVACHSGGNTIISAAEIAERTGTVRRSLAPILQRLSHVGLLESIPGPHGGYRLGRPAGAIRLYDVVTLALSSLRYIRPSLKGRLQCAVVEPLWAEFDAMLQERLEALTLEDLLRKAAESESRTQANES
jgi:Rrf2 family protein